MQVVAEMFIADLFIGHSKPVNYIIPPFCSNNIKSRYGGN